MRPRLVQITAASILPEPALFARLDRVAALPEAARRAFAVQLRDPEIPTRELAKLGRALRDHTRAIGAALIVNDRLDLAIAIGADGLHLGRRSLSVADARSLFGRGWISVACHAIEEVRRAAGEGADAALLSPIFASPGKGAPLGVEAIAEAIAAARRAVGGSAIQIIALGGVDAQGARACFAAGASAVAAIRADLVSILDANQGPC